MNDEELCIHPSRKECERNCRRYGLNKVLESLYKTCIYFSSLDNFSLKDTEEVAPTCAKIRELPGRLRNYQWDEYCQKITTYCEKILDGVSLDFLLLNSGRNVKESRNQFKKAEKDLERLKRNVSKLLSNLEDDMYNIDRRDGIWT